MSGLKRVIAHWAVTGYKATALARKHYHRIVEGDGTVVSGDYAPESNISPRPGSYAAHTRRLNTGSIGISMAAMAGAKWPNHAGPYPITERQFDAMCREIADLCQRYQIPVTPRTVLSHAEVQNTLGVKQNGKWDFTIIPFMPHVKGARPCGDEMRRRVTAYLQGHDVTASDGPESEGNERTRWLQRLLSSRGYDLGIPDGVVGPKTEGAILRFQIAHGLPQTGEFDTATVAALRSTDKLAQESAPIQPVKVPTPIIAALAALIAAIAGAFGGDAADIIKLLTGA